jgi:hypothetical protein
MKNLTDWGVTILGDEVYTPHEPGTGGKYVHLFPWQAAWDALLQHPWLTLPASHVGTARDQAR